MAKASELDDVTLVKIFIALRDRRARRKADYQLDDVEDKEKQDKIEIEFLKRFNERGIDNVSARGVGTAYRTVRASAKVSDWDSLLEFIKKEGAWEMLERRSKVFYNSGFVEGSVAKPTCYSNDGIAPASDAEEPQSKKCNVCPHNQWGSRITENGGKAMRFVEEEELATVESTLNDEADIIDQITGVADKPSISVEPVAESAPAPAAEPVAKPVEAKPKPAPKKEVKEVEEDEVDDALANLDFDD
eukprot:gene19763-31784_t